MKYSIIIVAMTISLQNQLCAMTQFEQKVGETIRLEDCSIATSLQQPMRLHIVDDAEAEEVRIAADHHKISNIYRAIDDDCLFVSIVSAHCDRNKFFWVAALCDLLIQDKNRKLYGTLADYASNRNTLKTLTATEVQRTLEQAKSLYSQQQQHINIALKSIGRERSIWIRNGFIQYKRQLMRAVAKASYLAHQRQVPVTDREAHQLSGNPLPAAQQPEHR